MRGGGACKVSFVKKMQIAILQRKIENDLFFTISGWRQ